ncbi:MAG TPA: malto-oligosyltrehalose synthase [Verrucomicrobiae bacterium]|nr:malto-oligosyltrehalose synthase [Verrucomicrobiae bacterium]
MPEIRIPTATYRLQFHKGFTFTQARDVLGYLDDLGVSDVYASPIFQARAGSTHGYDAVDPNRLNPELGTTEDFEALLAEVHRRGMGWLQDIVPNHMAFDGENPMLMDVLENGPASRYAEFFDIDWSYPHESMKGRVLAPFLGSFYGEALEKGEIKLAYGERGLDVTYYNLRLPLNIDSYGAVFQHGLGALRRKLGSDHPDLIKLLGVLYLLKNLPANEEATDRSTEINFVKRMLWELYTTNGDIRVFIDGNVARLNGEPGKPETFDALDQLLASQFFRLSFWKVATEEINYRRFFNINELICVRQEDENVFRATHKLILDLVHAGKFTGLRVDHIDGLYDPAKYLQRLRAEAGDVYLSVEKILALDEPLPEGWPIQGTTGYQFLNYVNGLFCDKKNERVFSDIYRRFAGFQTPYRDLVSEKKRLIIGKHMAGDVDALARLIKTISSRDRYARDITLYGLKRGLVEVLTFFPIYRTYINAEDYSDEDRYRLQEALSRAKDANPGLLLELSFIQRFLFLEAQQLGAEERKGWIHFIMRFQQLTGPLMAKGFEDTVLYIFNRLVSLNEVGGDPGRFGIAPETFHRYNTMRARLWPHAQSATATHDTKRGEDMRARINVLSEMPKEWERAVGRWRRANSKRTHLKGKEVPDPNDEYFLYQTLVGSFPADGAAGDYRDRLKAYMTKAVREAKVHTEWLKPDEAYEKAFAEFADEFLTAEPPTKFLNEFLPFTDKIAFYGMLNSLAQVLLKIAAPGVPDFYQGTELWDLSFVDPDNRRAVDFAHRASVLRDFKRREKENSASFVHELLDNWRDGRIKLYTVYKALNFRRAQSALFRSGDYSALEAKGKVKDNVCAFIRRHEASWAVAVAPRLMARLTAAGTPPLGEDVWGQNTIDLPAEAPDRWTNIFTGEEMRNGTTNGANVLRLADIFKTFPIALLASREGG